MGSMFSKHVEAVILGSDGGLNGWRALRIDPRFVPAVGDRVILPERCMAGEEDFFERVFEVTRIVRSYDNDGNLSIDVVVKHRPAQGYADLRGHEEQ